MTIKLEIDDTIWTEELASRNAAITDQVNRANASGEANHAARMKHTPETQRTKFQPQPVPTPLTLDQLISLAFAPVEKAISDRQKKVHLDVLANQSTKALSRMVKVVESSQEVQNALAKQVDAI